jgi:signal transduction histidine kinase
MWPGAEAISVKISLPSIEALFTTLRSNLNTLKPSEDSRERTANLLRTILLFSSALNLLNIANLLFLTYPADTQGLFISLSVLLAQAALYLLFRRGCIGFVSYAFVTVVWLSIGVAALRSEGLFNPIIGGYGSVILLAGLLIGGRAALVVAGMSVLSTGFYLALVYNGQMPTLLQSASPHTSWIDDVLLYLMDGMVLYVAARDINAAFVRARRIEHSLKAEIGRRAAVEETLRQNETRLHVALAGLPIVVFNQDRDLRYTWLHNSMQVRLENVVGKTDADLLPAPEAAYLTHLKQRVLADGVRWREEVQLTTSRGEVRDYDYIIEPLYDGAGCIMGITGATIDITERKQAEKVIQEAERMRVELAQERELAQLRSKFITTVSHEFRTPMAIIVSSRDLLERYYDRLTPERRIDHFKKIGDQVSYMVDVLEDVLTVSRTEDARMEFHPAITDVEAVCRKETSRLLPRQVGLSFEGDLTAVRVDANLLRLIVSNLLSNAAKYTPDDGRLSLSLRQDGDALELTVRDTGMGISPGDQERIFEPFYRGANAEHIPGTGLGLTIVSKAVAAHGGSIHIESAPAAGTAVIVRLSISP